MIKPSHVFTIRDMNRNVMFSATVENGAIKNVVDKDNSRDVSEFECICINDDMFYEMQIKRDGHLVCSYHSGSEITKLFNSSDVMVFKGYDNGDGDRWYDDNGVLLQSRSFTDDPYAQPSFLTETYYPNGQVKTKTYKSQHSTTQDEYDEKGNLIYMRDQPPSAPAYEHYHLFDNRNVTFSRVTLNDYEFLTGSYVYADVIQGMQEFEYYLDNLMEKDSSDISVTVEYYIVGNGDGDAEPATEKELEYLSEHNLCDALLLEEQSFSVDISFDHEDCDMEM